MSSKSNTAARRLTAACLAAFALVGAVLTVRKRREQQPRQDTVPEPPATQPAGADRAAAAAAESAEAYRKYVLSRRETAG